MPHPELDEANKVNASESDNANRRKALEFLKINIDVWNGLTPTDRKRDYHKIIMKAMLQNHPDKHPECVEGSPEHTQWVENTKLLSSLDYDDAIEKTDAVSDKEAASSSTSDDETKSATSRNTYFYAPKNALELINGIIQRDNTYTREKKGLGNEYYETFKELIPNMLSRNDSGKISRAVGCYGKDFAFVVDQIITKACLEGYYGADVLVSALVSRDQNRIKKSFDQMVSYIKSKNIFMRFFASTESLLNQFIDKFCQFAPVGGKGGAIVGIPADTVLVLCKSLSLALPYNIIDPNFDLDQELIRMSLKKYVSGTQQLLLLEASPTDALRIPSSETTEPFRIL